MMHSCHPHFPHEMEMMDHVKRSIAASYTSLLSRLDSHIEDNRMHVSCEEKDTWNNKADKTQIRDLEMRLMEKADYCDLIELKEALAKVKSVVNENTSSSSESGSDYITLKELERILETFKENVAEELDLSDYAKKSDLEEYAKKEDVYTKEEVDSKITSNPSQGLPTSILTVNYNDAVAQTAKGRYKIGTLTIGTSSVDIYGKDEIATVTSGEGDTQIIEHTYDDSLIQQQIEDIKNRLKKLMEDVTDEVQKNIDEMLTDEELIHRLFPDGSGTYSNFGKTLDSYLDSYLQAIGFYDEHGTTKWSLIEQSLQSIRAKVASIDPNIEGNYDALLSQLRQDITEEGALAELLTQCIRPSGSSRVRSFR